MFTSKNFTNGESISLSKEIALIGAESTPLTTLLMGGGKIEQATSTVHSWREKTLDATADISVPEGSETEVFTKSARKELSNVMEIFKKATALSGTAQAMNNVQFTEEIADRLVELKMNMEAKLINGVFKDGSASPFVRQMKGLIPFVETKNKLTFADTDPADDIVKGLARTLWNNKLVGGKYIALVNADLKEKIDQVYESNSRYIQPTNTYGVVANTILTNYGNVDLVLSQHVPSDKVVMFNDNYLKLAFLRQPTFEPLAKTGDNVKGHVLTEATLKVASPQAVALATVTTE